MKSFLFIKNLLILSKLCQGEVQGPVDLISMQSRVHFNHQNYVPKDIFPVLN